MVQRAWKSALGAIAPSAAFAGTIAAQFGRDAVLSARERSSNVVSRPVSLGR